MIISGTLASNYFLALFSEKKTEQGWKIGPSFSGKSSELYVFLSLFMGYKINLGIGGIKWSIYIYLAIFKVYPRKCLVWEVSYWKEGTLRFWTLKTLKIELFENSNFTRVGTYKKINKYQNSFKLMECKNQTRCIFIKWIYFIFIDELDFSFCRLHNACI